MDIYAQEGHKVIFNKPEAGWDGEVRATKRLMEDGIIELGKIYTVDHVDVGGWTSYVHLKEIPNRDFNTVQFSDLKGDDADE
jgi:hypothetical protein